jgi:hypothetical protein
MAKRREKRECKAVVLELDAAGIDIGAEEIYVAVPPDRDEESVRMFSSFTSDLHALADWLQKCRIRTVAMESTGGAIPLEAAHAEISEPYRDLARHPRAERFRPTVFARARQNEHS